MKATPLFKFLIQQLLYVRQWKRLPRKLKKRWFNDYWHSLRATPKGP